MGKPHVMMVPCPLQGHIVPLMELGQRLAKRGIRITFVIPESTRQNIIKANNMVEELVRLVSVPDETESGKQHRMLPDKIKGLILEINGSSDEDKVTCIVYDQIYGRIGEVAKNMGIKTSAFLAAPAALVVLQSNTEKMIEDGIVDSEGTPIKQQIIQFGPSLPLISTSDFLWISKIPLPVQKQIFNIMIENNKGIKYADWQICNSVYDLEPGAFVLVPELLPIGPLLASNRLVNSTAHLWEQDYSCLNWLDQQKPNSVIYVAFGSLTILNSTQFQELALGLELINKPFLWAVRPEIVTALEPEQAFPEGFLDRVSNRGLITGWAPQQQVLSHASIACFLSHCGWNSTIESLSNGVPFLCWPYNADQFMNRSYICDIWKVGMGFVENDNGIITSGEIKNKADKLIDDLDVFKERALDLKEKILSSAREGGNSHKNFTNFFEWIKS